MANGDFRHSRAGGKPEWPRHWIPACEGMTLFDFEILTQSRGDAKLRKEFK
jgi:hypothetical protein